MAVSTESKTLRELREAAGMTQLDVAFELGVTPQTVYNWERGTREPKARQLQQLARLFKTSADNVLIVERPELESKLAA